MEAPRKVDDVLHARWVIPIVPDGLYLENHSVVIHEGKILDILPTADAKVQYISDAQHPFEDHHVLLPGLVNLHSHAAMTLLRGFADDVSLSDWLQNYIWPAEGKWVGEEFVEDGTKIAVAEMIRCGVTCYNDMYHFPHITAKVTSDYGMRASIGIPVLMFPTNWAQNTVEYVDKGKAHLYESYKDHPLVKVTVAPHAPYTVDDEGFLLAKKVAEEHNLRIHTHLHETENEVVEHVGRYNKRPIQRLDELGIVGPNLIAVHMTQLTEEEIKLFAEKGAHVVHCPESNLKLVSGTCPVAKLISAGVNVALGTDSAASNDDLDLFGEIRTASLLDKLQAHDATALPAWQMLKIATINGAKALGLEKEIGSLEKGKSADIIAIKLRTEPVYNPITNLVYVGTNTVTDVWVAGKALLKDGEFTVIDEAAIMKKAKGWGDKIKAWKADLNGSKQSS